jgi:hypothetical protein
MCTMYYPHGNRGSMDMSTICVLAKITVTVQEHFSFTLHYFSAPFQVHAVILVSNSSSSDISTQSSSGGIFEFHQRNQLYLHGFKYMCPQKNECNFSGKLLLHSIIFFRIFPSLCRHIGVTFMVVRHLNPKLQWGNF